MRACGPVRRAFPLPFKGYRRNGCDTVNAPRPVAPKPSEFTRRLSPGTPTLQRSSIRPSYPSRPRAAIDFFNLPTSVSPGQRAPCALRHGAATHNETPQTAASGETHVRRNQKVPPRSRSWRHPRRERPRLSFRERRDPQPRRKSRGPGSPLRARQPKGSQHHRSLRFALDGFRRPRPRGLIERSPGKRTMNALLDLADVSTVNTAELGLPMRMLITKVRPRSSQVGG